MRVRRSRLARLSGAIVAAGTALAAVAAPGLAQAHPHPHPKVTTVASGLDNPRGLGFAPDGSLYVAESGRGGSGPCFSGPEGGEVCYGATGAITRIKNGQQRRVLTGLPSIAEHDGSGASGPSDVSLKGRGGLYFTVGLGANPADRAGLPPSGQAASGWLLRGLGASGSWKQVADIAGYEGTANPDGGEPDSNPTSVQALSSGQVVADAGGNSLLRVSRKGTVSTLAVFPDHDGAQSVPTSVVRGPDGAFYVGELTGFPFTPGSARVYRVVPGQAPTVYASGFTNIMDIGFDSRGKLYVLEIAHNGLLSGDPTGALIRVGKHGHHKIIHSEGLIMPGGLALRGGAAYVSNCGVCAGGGSVLRIPLTH